MTPRPTTDTNPDNGLADPRPHPLRRPWAAALAFGIGLSLAADCGASAFGRNGFSGNPGTNGGITCTACHAPGAPTPTVTLSGPTLVDAGSTHTYAVEIVGGPGRNAGMSVSVSDFAGELAELDTTLHRVGEELSHTAPVASPGAAVGFRFRWTAPNYDATLDMYAAGNSGNGGFDLLGDGIGSDTLRITVRNGGPAPPDPPAVPASVTPVPFASGLRRPVAITHAGDERLFVVEQPGLVRTVATDGTVSPTPFLDIGTAVDDTGNEQGLLGLAFHPDYADNGRFYIHYTYDPGPGPDRSRVSRFQVGADPARADPNSEWVLLEFEQPFANHNAGDLHFGPDGYLYIASGDGGSGGDPRNLAQNERSLLGKLLRIDVDAAGGGETDCGLGPPGRYRTPPGNAFSDGPGGQGCDEIFASGLRNPWRFSFDRLEGNLWIADVGQNAFEEINFTTVGSGGGLNYGWRCFEADTPFSSDPCGEIYLPPVHVLDHDDGDCSVTGGVVYRGFDYPGLFGRYFFSDFCNTAIRTLRFTGAGLTEETATPAGSVNTPSAFGENRVGELYLASLSSGALYRLEDSRASGTIIGEVGTLTAAQPDADYWHTVRFRNRYSRPVVVGGPPTSNGPGPIGFRVRNVTADGFEFQLDEWQYQDGRHVPETVGYLVVEAGSHRLLDGTRLDAGLRLVDHRWKAIDFVQPFPDPPVVVVTTSSNRGPAPVTERLRAVGKTGFEVGLQEEQAADDRHALERLGWVAIDAGVGARQEAQTVDLVGHTTVTASLSRGFPSPPVVVGDLQTYRGADPVALRITSRSAVEVGLRAQEERSFDLETNHVMEQAGYAAFVIGDLKTR